MIKITYYLPQHILYNEELETLYKSPSWTSSKIFRKTGIKSRPTAREELVSDMAVKAAQKLFNEYGIQPADIDFILLCTQSPDYFLPTTACIVQDRLGIPTTAGAMDYNLGCSGYIYGLAQAKGLLSIGAAENVLLITAETYTKYIHPFDRSTRTIFGDAASATLITSNDAGVIGKFVFGTDGSGAQNLIVPASGMARKRDETTSAAETDSSGNIRSADNLYMNGPEIFAFTLRTVPPMIRAALKKNNLTLGDVDYFILHQANAFILETLRDNLKIPEDKFCIDLEYLGNTVSSTIPIALKRSLTNGFLSDKKNACVLIAGFGVGYSWGATILKIQLQSEGTI